MPGNLQGMHLPKAGPRYRASCSLCSVKPHARSLIRPFARSLVRSFVRSFGNLVARVLVLKLHGNGNRRTMCFASFGYPGCFDEPRVTRRLATFRVHNASTPTPDLCSLTRCSPLLSSLPILTSTHISVHLFIHPSCWKPACHPQTIRLFPYRD